MRARIAALVLPTLCGCGLFLSELNRPIAKDANGFDDLRSEQEPPHAVLVDGDVRDFVTFRAEPGASIEAWTDDSSYAPRGTVDDRGHFSLRIDVCRSRLTAGEQFSEWLLFGSNDTCARWLEYFRFRARLGDRCSLTYRGDALPKERGPLVLWLRPCAEVEPVQRRPVER